MTKKEMILAIQVAEAKAWKQLSEDKKHFGQDDIITRGTRREWNALYELRKQLGLEGLPVLELLEMNLLPDHKPQVA